VSDIFLCPALMTTAQLQRAGHAAHHNYLGTETDPDHGLDNETSLKHYRTRTFDHKTMLSLFFYDVMDSVLFTQTALGSLAEAPLQILSWWAVVGFALCMLDPVNSIQRMSTLQFSTDYAVALIVPYHVARCTIGYASYIFREIIDHSGLPSTSILNVNLLPLQLNQGDDKMGLILWLL
jgi:hypothetical protein